MIDSVKLSSLRRVLPLIAVVALLSACSAMAPAPVRDGKPPPEGAPASVTPEGVHIVRPGDTLMGIARLYGVTAKDLALWNTLTDPNQLQVGQEVRVAPPGGTVVQPIAIAQPVEVQPIGPGTAIVGTPIKQEPKGGKRPYTDEAWAALQPAPVAPPPVSVTADPAKGGPASVWRWPVLGRVIATFDEATNKGVDIAGKPGDPVSAAAGGKVVYSGSGLRGYGKLVIIKHDADYLSAYAHNQQLLVKEGESVNQGQKIAELGSTDSDRPKLHFEIRKQGRPVDPLKYLPVR